MKKLITMLLAVGLIATAAIGSTLATEAARNDLATQINNTESIYIDQKVQQRDAAGTLQLVAEELTKPLFPAVYQGEVPVVKDGYFNAVGNAVDYFVSVTRAADAGDAAATDADGSQDSTAAQNGGVSVRTVFAFQDTNNIVDKMYFNVNRDGVTWQGIGQNGRVTENAVKTTINGIDYRLFVCTCNSVDVNETMYSMKQFCFDKGVTGKEFNFGQYRIMVKSWAVSDETVFTNITEDVHPWTASVLEKTSQAAAQNSETEV
ncbi:MAG: hypothetical protein IJA90_10505 [Peptococcaceae bacterium]|nr:hypothetical protein [Peptococcaceae bacterium]